MAIPTILVDTTFSGKNISSSAVSVYEYVATADVTIRLQVRLSAVVGGGEYTAYLTLNDGDGQSDDAIGPRTTYSAAINETAFWFATICVDLMAGDAINVMVQGLAADASESGSIRIFSDSLSGASLADDAITAAKIAPAAIGASEAPLLANLDATISSRSTLTVANILAGIFEGTSTIQDFFRLASSVLFGKSTGGGTANPKFRDLADTKNRIDATTDVNGNRSAVSRDAT